jgi:transcriptional regulator with XRE-family HTH domain
MNLNEDIIRIRKQQGLTQQALAEKAGVRIAALCEFETGKSEMSTKNLKKIFKVLNVKITDNHKIEKARVIETEENLLKYKSEIEELVLFAKRIHFDIEHGDLVELVRLWINDNKSLYSEENKRRLLTLLKSSK